MTFFLESFLARSALRSFASGWRRCENDTIYTRESYSLRKSLKNSAIWDGINPVMLKEPANVIDIDRQISFSIILKMSRQSRQISTECKNQKCYTHLQEVQQRMSRDKYTSQEPGVTPVNRVWKMCGVLKTVCWKWLVPSFTLQIILRHCKGFA